MRIITNFPLAILLILLLTAFLMPLIKRTKILLFLSKCSISIALIFSILCFVHVDQWGAFKYQIGYPGTLLGIEFFIGYIEAIMSITFCFVTLMVVFYSGSPDYTEIKKNKTTYFYTLLNILLASLIGINFTNDLFNAYVFVEVATLASCGLVIVKDYSENIKATLKYLIMSTIGSGLLLMGIAFIYSHTGHLNIDAIHALLIKNYTGYPKSIFITLSLFTAGLGVKSALFPLHTWLPDAHASAPTSSSALLSGIVLKGFILLLIKILFRVFGYEIVSQYPLFHFILILGSLGMLIGSLYAIFQKNIKRLIAYSSIAQMGYIFFGIGLGTLAGLQIAIFHIVGHAITKSALFLITGLMIEQSGSKEIKDLKGLGIEMPAAFAMFTLCSFSMIGIPVLPGFISKWYLSIESISSGQFILLFIILISSLLNAVYYFPIIINGFFGLENLAGKRANSKKISKSLIAPITILTSAMILLGFFSKYILECIYKGLLQY